MKSLRSVPLSHLCAESFFRVDMATVAVVSNQNVVERMTSLPLVSSTYGLVSSVYYNTKDTHPYIRSVCEAAEHGVRTITSVARITALPIIEKLEPQISIANDLACKSLDKIEKTLPILRQPSEQIVANAKDAVTSAKDAVSVTVTGAKDTVSGTLISVAGKTRGMVSGSVSTVMESRVGRLVSSGMDTALSTSESLVDQYLPQTGEELELEAKAVKEFDKEQSYYVRLGSLSTKLRRRAYDRALDKIRNAKQHSQDSITQLSHTVDLIEYAKHNIDGANQVVYDKLNSLVGWKFNGSDKERNYHQAEVIESRTLAMAHSLTQQLQTTCLGLLSGLQGLPNNIQQEALLLSSSASQVYTSFSKATSFGELPDSMLANSKMQLGKMKDSLDNVMDYLVNNTPLNWLVGPFYPRMALKSPGRTVPAATSACVSPKLYQEAPTDVEMDSLESHKQW
ncbi:perilipin-2 [Lampris incognitus]|uniref:perilipin-2 n=1 Tax=Lampris incognitus TaxID=2546036 RepID=UPI0024B5C277|nr:perilipin-2 [Lampris incognitus]